MCTFQRFIKLIAKQHDNICLFKSGLSDFLQALSFLVSCHVISSALSCVIQPVLCWEDKRGSANTNLFYLHVSGEISLSQRLLVCAPITKLRATIQISLFVFILLGILCLHCWHNKMFCFHAFDIHLKSTPQGFPSHKGTYHNKIK